MEPGAYETLERLALPTPQRLSLDAVRSTDHRTLFVRTRNNAVPSEPISVEALELRISNGYYQPDDILSLDEVIEADVSGVLVTLDSGFYLECVSGQLEGLVRGANVDLRVLRTRREVGNPVFQRVRIGSRPLNSRSVESVISGVEGAIARLPAGILLEFLLCRARGSPVFVDAKPFEWEVAYAALFEVGRPPLLFGSAADLTEIEWNEFIALSPAATQGVVVRVGDHPLLCHAVTYALKSGVGALLR